MNALDAMDELTIDLIATDPEYAIGVIRDYLRGGGIPTAGWMLVLLAEIERLNEALNAPVAQK